MNPTEGICKKTRAFAGLDGCNILFQSNCEGIGSSRKSAGKMYAAQNAEQYELVVQEIEVQWVILRAYLDKTYDRLANPVKAANKTAFWTASEKMEYFKCV